MSKIYIDNMHCDNYTSSITFNPIYDIVLHFIKSKANHNKLNY